MTTSNVSSNPAVDRNTDVQIHNEGTIFLFELLTTQAREWVATNVQPEPWQMHGHSLAVDHRFARDLAAAMATELEVR